MEKLIINSNDILHNINEIKSKITTKDYTIIAVVKGNAYGLGIIEFTNLLIKKGINFFAVATEDEALQLREAGIKNKILLLTPLTSKEDLIDLVKNDITLTVDSVNGATIINEIAKELNKKVSVHIKIDTGFSRYGFDYNQEEDIIKIINECNNIIYEGIYSHLSNSLAKDRTFSDIQFQRFTNLIKKLKEKNIEFKYRHICNSSAFFKYPNMHLNCARIGSAFSGNAVGIDNSLKKIGLLQTKIVKIKTINKGEYIGYGNSYKAKKQMKVAIIPVGYYKGVGITLKDQRFKFLSKVKRIVIDIKKIFDKDFIIINGEKLELLGQIGMNNIVVNITGKNYKENDEILLYVRPIFIDSNVKRIYKNM